MNRRKFLQNIFAAGVGAGTLMASNPMRMMISSAKAAEGKTLIVISQNGGCDGLNTVVPYGDDNYYSLRPTIAISRPGEGEGSAIDLNGFLGLHPALAPFSDIYQAGAMAIMPAVHYPSASRSHFRSMQLIQSAELQNEDTDGWLNRHLQTHSHINSFRAVSFGNNLPQSFNGPESVATLTSISNFSLGINSDEQTMLLNRIDPVYRQEGGSSKRQLLKRFGVKTIEDLETIQALRNQVYEPANGAVYPNTGLGRNLRDMAQLIKAGIGLELATVGIGGWDTHNNQGGATGSQARRHSDFAGSIAAFYQDMGERMNDVVIMTSTEFGRTSAENGSQGTDHGFASTWFVIGGGVQGGIHGDWPGLAPTQLRNGRYLDMSIDYRNIYAEILQNHLVNDRIDDVIRDFSPQSIGLFG